MDVQPVPTDVEAKLKELDQLYANVCSQLGEVNFQYKVTTDRFYEQLTDIQKRYIAIKDVTKKASDTVKKVATQIMKEAQHGGSEEENPNPKTE